MRFKKAQFFSIMCCPAKNWQPSDARFNPRSRLSTQSFGVSCCFLRIYGLGKIPQKTLHGAHSLSPRSLAQTIGFHRTYITSIMCKNDALTFGSISKIVSQCLNLLQISYFYLKDVKKSFLIPMMMDYVFSRRVTYIVHCEVFKPFITPHNQQSIFQCFYKNLRCFLISSQKTLSLT